MIADLHTENGYPLTTLCQVLGLARSSFYCQPGELADGALQEAIQQIQGQFPTYGTRRVTAQLRRAPYHMTINRKRVQAVVTTLQTDQKAHDQQPTWVSTLPQSGQGCGH
jgi:hypothetical protein